MFISNFFRISLLAVLFSPACAVPVTPDTQNSITTLNARATKDSRLSRATKEAQEIIKSFAAERGINSFKLLVAQFDFHDRKKLEDFYTDSCKVRFQGVPAPLIICNAEFLLESEAVIRAFHFPNEYHLSDKAMYGLVRKVSSDPLDYLKQLRKLTPPARGGAHAFEEHMSRDLKILIVFFAAHELGHILEWQNNGSLLTTLPADAPLETKVSSAVAKMCMHTDDFYQIGFRLPFLQEATETGSDIRKVERELKNLNDIENVYKWHEKDFAEEAAADQTAIELIVGYLNELETKDEALAFEEQYEIVNILFWLGLYHWYKDLWNFTEKACDSREPIISIDDLMLCMARARDQYIKVSSLFGPNHRFILLRSYLAIEAIIEKRTDYFKLPLEQRTIWMPIPEEKLRELPNEEFKRVWGYYGNLQAYAVLHTLMDTPIKFAYVGCSTGWMKEIDEVRVNPQILLMDFEPLEQVWKRLVKWWP